MTSKDLSIYISDFLSYAYSQKIELYNEYSLQHELGIFLRNKCPNFSVQFERNTNFFGIDSTTVKKEIDVVVYNNCEKFAIELKFPCNRAYPRRMFQFIQDICFIEQLKHNGFTGGCAVVLVDDPNFYSNQERLEISGIYSYFRDGNSIKGVISNPMPKVLKQLIIKNSYNAIWNSTNFWDRDKAADPIKSVPAKYYIIEI